MASLVDEIILLLAKAGYTIEAKMAMIRMKWEAAKTHALISFVLFICRLKLRTGWTWL